ncbi:cytochrome P450 [Nocardia sp. NBC_01377]|uniref:cytochrome P450 n=1 Tax=Nocardia sp. NBC_01377 TaxID=2903595 RepID=UPI0032457DC8
MTAPIDSGTTATKFQFPDTPDQNRFEAVCENLRELAPVVCVDLPDGLEAWVITRYADGKRAFMDPRLVKDLRNLTDPSHGLGGARYAEDTFAVEGRHMLNSDGVEHTRLRKAVGSELSSAAIARRRPEIEQVCRDLVRDFRDEPTAELMDAYARPVPEIVMARVLGIEDDILRSAAVFSRRLGERADPAAPDMRKAYHDLVDMIVDCTRNPGDAPEGTVLSALHRAHAAKTISRRELLSTVSMLLGAGISSTAIAIGHSASTLLSSASTLRGLLDDEREAAVLVEELLRHHPPFPFSPWRFAREAVEVAGVTIPAGAVVFVLLAAVNRDPAVIADATALVPDRRDRATHLTFGYGPHFCIGAHLARTEIAVALSVLFEELPHLRLASTETQWYGLLFDRTPATLPVLTGAMS